MTLADRTRGVIINADSAQIYSEIPILSAAPTPADLGRVEHRLFGTLDGSEPCSAAHWAELARREIADVHASGRLPILVGGTGLYVRTLLDGIAPVPTIASETRAVVRAASVEDNYDRLRQLDPAAAARLNPADTTRVARALEVILSTGRALAKWQEERVGGLGSSIDLQPIILLPPRDWLYQRCDKRFALMFAGGAIEEVEALMSRHMNPNLPIMRAIGVQEIAGYLSGALTSEQAIVAGQQATRRYAKRQYTWFAHQPPAEWPRFHEALDERNTSAALELLHATA
jgi:tRNA dimethylallyltransferase